MKAKEVCPQSATHLKLNIAPCLFLEQTFLFCTCRGTSLLPLHQSAAGRKKSPLLMRVGASLHRSKTYVLQPIYMLTTGFGNFSEEEFSLMLAATATGQPL